MVSRSGPGSDETVIAGSWASETLPMSVRRELLERELRKLGFCRAGGPRQGAEAAPGPQHSGGSQHPQADGSEAHGD